jgi:hypothetical protein
VQELRIAAMAGTMQMRVSFFIRWIGNCMWDSSQVPCSDVLKGVFYDDAIGTSRPKLLEA